MQQLDQLYERWGKFLATDPDELSDKSEALRSLLRDFCAAGRFVPPGDERRRFEGVASQIARGISRLTGAIEPSAVIEAYDGNPRFRKDVDGMPPRSSLFLGREKEIEELTGYLDDPECRFVQVTGVGGQGKTQLVNHWIAWLEKQGPAAIDSLYCHTFYTFPSHSFKKVPEFIEKSHRFFLGEPEVESPRERWAAELSWAVGAGSVDVENAPESLSPEIIEHLGRLLSRGPQLRILILDGLEATLSHPPGILKEEANDIEILLKGLLELTDGFCIITSRFPLKLLEQYEKRGLVRNLPLKGLQPKEGARFLRQLRVEGGEHELQELSQRLGGHPVSLLAYGDILADKANGSPAWQPRTQISISPISVPELLVKLDDPSWRKDDERAWQASDSEDMATERVKGLLRSYLRYFDSPGQPFERKISIEFMRLLAFFQEPSTLQDLQVLIRLPDIPALNGHLRELIDERDVNLGRLIDLVDNLERRQLIQKSLRVLPDLPEEEKNETQPEVPPFIETHPLLRDFFRQELLNEPALKAAWQVGHRALAEHYLKVRSESDGHPKTRHDLRMYYRAVEHACQAEKWDLAYKVYWRKIHRNSYKIGEDQYQWYAWEKFGLLSHDIRTLSWFYREQPGRPLWVSFEESFQRQSQQQKVHIRTATGLCLLNLGYIKDAGPPLNDAYSSAENSDTLTASILGGLMGDRCLVQGNLKQAEEWIDKALAASLKSEDAAQLRSKQAKKGNLLACKGEWESAQAAFKKMMKHHRDYLGRTQESKQHEPPSTRSGYYYFDFLLSCAAIVLSGRRSPAELGFDDPPDGNNKDWALKLIQEVRNDADYVFKKLRDLNEQDRAMNELTYARAVGEMAIYSSAGNSEKREELGHALEFLEEAQRRQEELGRRQDLPLTLIAKGHVQRHLGQFENALDSLHEAFRIIWEGDMHLYEADANMVRSAVYLDLANKSVDKQERHRLQGYASDSYQQAAQWMHSLKYRKHVFELAVLRDTLIEAGILPNELPEINA